MRVGFDLVYRLGNYLPDQKGVSAYISAAYAYISDFANRPENEYRLHKRKCRVYTWKEVSA